MNGEYVVAVGERLQRVGTVRFGGVRERQISFFRYADDWIENPSAFALAPSLPLSGSRPIARGGRSRAAGRVAHRLPTLARLSPAIPQLANKFFFSKKRKPRTAKRGHFCFGEKGTFLLCVDKMRVVVERINPNCYLRLVKRLTIQSGFRDTRFLRSR